MKAFGQVLVIDDVPLNVTMLCEMVGGLDGLEPVGFHDPIAALEWCRANTPILILTDFEMPGLDGAQFIEKVRATEAGAIVPVVVVTAYSDRRRLLNALSAGANDFIRKPLDELEVLARVRSLSQLGFAAQQVANLALYDELTGLATRRHFLSRLNAEIDQARIAHRPLSLVMFDIDHFKQINDSGEHEAGDAVLRDLAARLSTMVRASDFVGRLGGEEFAWALSATTLSDAQSAAERLRSLLEETPFTGNRRVTASFGVAMLQNLEESADLLRRADGLLYKAKANGRNCVICEPQRLSI